MLFWKLTKGQGIDSKTPWLFSVAFCMENICFIYIRRHLIRHPSKAPFKNCFFVTRYPSPRSGALTIGIRVSYAKKRFLKGALKGVLEGCLLNGSGVTIVYNREQSVFCELEPNQKSYLSQSKTFSLLCCVDGAHSCSRQENCSLDCFLKKKM